MITKERIKNIPSKRNITFHITGNLSVYIYKYNICMWRNECTDGTFYEKLFFYMFYL